MKDNKKIAGVILTGHDGRRAIVHHLCVHPDFRRQGVARMLVQRAEEALRIKYSDWFSKITMRQMNSGKGRDIRFVQT
jgi:ribosomal protein S18 acetylase RimI-like enzyme